MLAIVVAELGGPEVLVLAEQPDPVPGPGQVVVEVAAAGVNFIDIYRRPGVYKQPVPYVPGSEGAGTVVAVGEGVHEFSAGDHVAWCEGPGSYAERVAVAAHQAVPVPEGIDLKLAGAVMLQVRIGNPTAGHSRNARSSFGRRTCNVRQMPGSRSPNSRMVAKPVSRENLIANTPDPKTTLTVTDC